MQSCLPVSVPAAARPDADLGLTDQHSRHSWQVTQQLHLFCMMTILLFWLSLETLSYAEPTAQRTLRDFSAER